MHRQGSPGCACGLHLGASGWLCGHVCSPWLYDPSLIAPHSSGCAASTLNGLLACLLDSLPSPGPRQRPSSLPPVLPPSCAFPLPAPQGGAFAAEGIDQILQGRTEKRQIGGRAGNTFSVATFAVGPPVSPTVHSTSQQTESAPDECRLPSLPAHV